MLPVTTKTTAVDKTFIFKIDLPDGYTVDIPALNKTDYNFTEDFGGTWYDVGIKTNTSVTKNMNMTIHCGDMAIGFFGMNILSPTSIDLSNAFVCDAANDLMGMNSSLKKWNKLIDELHLGGAADYIEITIPVAYSTSNTFTWTNDAGESGQDVDDYVEWRDGGSSNTICKVPVSMGFSAYTVATPAADGGDDSGSGSGGGGGGGVATTANETNNETTVDGSDTGDSGEEETEDKGVGETVADAIDNLKEISWKSWVWIGGIALLIVIVIAGFVFYKKRE